MSTFEQDQREDITMPVVNKGQPNHNPQKGAAGVSKRKTPKHFKDESHGAAENTTKKQQNSI